MEFKKEIRVVIESLKKCPADWNFNNAFMKDYKLIK